MYGRMDRLTNLVTDTVMELYETKRGMLLLQFVKAHQYLILQSGRPSELSGGVSADVAYSQFRQSGVFAPAGVTLRFASITRRFRARNMAPYD